MIARIGYFEGLTGVQRKAQEDNMTRRFKAALTSQPGLLGFYLLEREDGVRMAFSIWESEAAMREGGAKANATPLLAGQRAEDIPDAGRVEIWQVRDSHTVPVTAGA